MDTENFKKDLRLVIDQNPQPIKFTITHCNPRIRKEEFATKKDFGLRLLEILEDPELSDVHLLIVKEKGMIGRYTSMKQVCDWHRFSTSMGKSKKQVIQKNIEAMTFLVETKTDVENRKKHYERMSVQEKYYHDK